ncbi:uncharacterized protein [Spinacia oleracea]|uniref:Reverse transcriptase domain-containing protein n=1 Tax=Spinacia oleracea TaxID=3562 RepID=A0ABM3R810_SPIOL|nr:uncharacterized protein LOC130467290 [Spinacia oleracea]
MNICSWNVRGMNDPSKVGDIKNFVNINKISVVALIETRVKLKHSSKIQNKFGAQWHWVSNYDHSDRGRIWIAVYGLHSIETKRSLWRELGSLSALNNLAWLVMGDFNSVLYSGDRVNGNFVTNAETIDFETCLSQTDLTELKSCGHFYSWYKGHEVHRISSRIDRAFGNSCWHGTYSDVVVDYMNPGLSDHTPLAMNYKKGWEKNQATSAMQNIWNKLKAVKVELKALHKQEFAQLENNIEKCRRDLVVAQSISIANPDDNVAQEKEKECVAKLKLFLKVQESAYRQKSRIQWLQLGDSNSKFFFSAMKERYAINSIDVLYDDQDTKLTNETDIQAEIKKIYEKLIGSAATSLTDSLIIPISDLEIDTAIKGINVNKAPGLDGFNSLFFHKTWSIVKADIYNEIREFFDTGVLLKPINNTAVTLIPKIQNASTVKDFRPIACCSVVYKIISKILTARMQGVIGKVVHCAQAGFIIGRNIADNILLASELIKCYFRKNISPRCMIKVDLKKAYDSIEWPFLESMLVELGFPAIFVKWIMQCLGSVSYSILVNDDLLMFARDDIPSVSAIFQAFTKFSKASGLEANLHKSDVYVAGVSDSAASQIVDTLGIAKGSFPFKYLGVPLTTRKLSYTDCKPLIEKTVARIKSWATKFLSYAGRLQLVRSVLFGIQLYWCQIFVMPKKDLTIWNKAAVLKHCWDLSMKQDRLWIKWMHTYYVKHHNFWTMQVPNGLTWSMRKIWANRDVFVDSGDTGQFITHGKYSIQKMYLHLRQNATAVSWKRIVCNSKASPKATFIVWLALQNRLATKERLLKWNMQIDGGCVNCQTQTEQFRPGKERLIGQQRRAEVQSQGTKSAVWHLWKQFTISDCKETLRCDDQMRKCLF